MKPADQQLRGKRALVTGASRGIGASTALLLGLMGAELTIIGRSPELEAVAEQIEREAGVPAQAIHADLRKEKDIEWVAETVNPQGIDILVNNAGIGHFGPVQDPGLLTLAQWDEMFSLNVRAVFYLTKLLLPGMIERGSGDIVNIGARAAHDATRESAGYSASKAAVILFSDALRHDLRRTGVRVVVVSPGIVNTTFYGEKRAPLQPSTNLTHYLQPSDVAIEIVRVVCNDRHIGVKELMLIGEHQPW